MAARVTRIDYKPEPGAAAPQPVAGPHFLEISRDKLVDDPEAPEGQRLETEVVQFELAGDISSMLLLEMAAVSSGAGSDEDGEFAALIWQIFREALPKTEQRKFRNWVQAAKPKIEMRELVSYIGGMVGAMTGRPPEGQSPSLAGLPETPTTSTEPSAPPATTAGSAL